MFDLVVVPRLITAIASSVANFSLPFANFDLMIRIPFSISVMAASCFLSAEAHDSNNRDDNLASSSIVSFIDSAAEDQACTELAWTVISINSLTVIIFRLNILLPGRQARSSSVSPPSLLAHARPGFDATAISTTATALVVATVLHIDPKSCRRSVAAVVDTLLLFLLSSSSCEAKARKCWCGSDAGIHASTARRHTNEAIVGSRGGESFMLRGIQLVHICKIHTFSASIRNRHPADVLTERPFFRFTSISTAPHFVPASLTTKP